MEPIIKWVGGKRQLLSEIKKYIPKNIKIYYEPFIGGGAVLFETAPEKAVLGDVNPELINLYKVVKNKHLKLLAELKKHKTNNSEDYYYYIRGLDRTENFHELSDVVRAARFIYLNKVCYNGLWRVNSKGENNTPYGKYNNPSIYNKESIIEMHKYLRDKKVKILYGDFEKCVKKAVEGDFVYFDPPYAPISTTANFTSYASEGFGVEDQIRLKKTCDKLNKRGVKFLLSNSNCEFIRELYKDYIVEIVEANRAINSDAAKRGKVEEVLIRNYENC